MAHKERGDTLVEVLMAIVILSVVIIGAITVMTRGLQAAQMALEQSQVRMSINSQMEMLRLLRDQYIVDKDSPNGQVWKSIADSSNDQPIVYNDNCDVTPAKTASAFYLQQTDPQIVKQSFNPILAPTTVAIPGQGLWVETVKSSSVSPAYIDFVVRACWLASGGGQQRTVTAVRLYDPSR